jgi:hypothetical protein
MLTVYLDQGGAGEIEVAYQEEYQDSSPTPQPEYYPQ